MNKNIPYVFKKCKSCGKIKHINKFKKNKACKFGVENKCKECYKIYNKKYRNDNKEDILKRERKYKKHIKKTYQIIIKKYKKKDIIKTTIIIIKKNMKNIVMIIRKNLKIIIEIIIITIKKRLIKLTKNGKNVILKRC